MGSRVLAVTLNPAVDVSARTRAVTTEHKLRCTDVRRDAGGGAVNVARVLKRLGGDGRVLYPAGAFLGQLLQKLLEHEGIDSRALQIDEETRESFTVLEESSGREWRFVLPGPRLAQADWQACLDAVGSEGGPGGYVVASGSLPPGVPEDFYARLAGVCRRLGARMVLDASGPALAAAMEAGVYLVKPNLRELRELTGLALEKEEDWTSAAAGLVASGGAEVVALSLGHRGALLSAAGIRLRAPALLVKVASTVGAGDSFVAAMVWRLADGAGLEDAFRHGMAGGTAALLAPGTSLAHKPDVERLISEVRLHRSRAPEDDAALE